MSRSPRLLFLAPALVVGGALLAGCGASDTPTPATPPPPTATATSVPPTATATRGPSATPTLPVPTGTVIGQPTQPSAPTPVSGSATATPTLPAGATLFERLAALGGVALPGGPTAASDPPHLVLASPDGTTVEALPGPEGSQSERDGIVSPDGKAVALVVDGALARLDLQTLFAERTRPLTELGDLGSFVTPCAWFPDSARLLFSFQGSGSLVPQGLAIYDWSTGDLAVVDSARLQSSGGFELRGCGAPSPDGASVYYTAIMGSGATGRSRLFVAPADGGPAQPLTAAATDVAGPPALGPDGARAVFDVTAADPPPVEDTNWEVASLDLAGGGSAVNLTLDGHYDVGGSVSPDGASVAFISNRDGTLALWTAPVAGGTPVKVAELPGEDAGFHRGVTSWSPDGSHIAVSVSLKDGPSSDLFVVDPAGGTVTPLGQRLRFLVQPRWLPDGSGLLY